MNNVVTPTIRRDEQKPAKRPPSRNVPGLSHTGIAPLYRAERSHDRDNRSDRQYRRVLPQPSRSFFSRGAAGKPVDLSESPVLRSAHAASRGHGRRVGRDRPRRTGDGAGRRGALREPRPDRRPTGPLSHRFPARLRRGGPLRPQALPGRRRARRPRRGTCPRPRPGPPAGPHPVRPRRGGVRQRLALCADVPAARHRPGRDLAPGPHHRAGPHRHRGRGDPRRAALTGPGPARRHPGPRRLGRLPRRTAFHGRRPAGRPRPRRTLARTDPGLPQLRRAAPGAGRNPAAHRVHAAASDRRRVRRLAADRAPRLRARHDRPPRLRLRGGRPLYLPCRSAAAGQGPPRLRRDLRPPRTPRLRPAARPQRSPPVSPGAARPAGAHAGIPGAGVVRDGLRSCHAVAARRARRPARARRPPPAEKSTRARSSTRATDSWANRSAYAARISSIFGSFGRARDAG